MPIAILSALKTCTHVCRTRGGSSALIVCLIFFAAACRQAPPVLETAVQNVSPNGGVIALPGGVSATFDPGFLNTAADVTFSLSDALPNYPQEVAASYGGAEAVAKGVLVTFAAAALAPATDLSEAALTLRVPAVVPSLGDNERLLAEVLLELPDGRQLFFFEPYARVEGDTGQEFAGTDTVTIRAGQLRADGEARSDTVRITVRPVRLGAGQVDPQATLPSGFGLEVVASGFDGGVAFDFAADERAFVAEKRGVVKVLQNGRVLSAPFIDLSHEVNNFHDRGMLGVAVHPDFPAKPYVYVLYTYDPPEVQGGSGYGGPDNGGARVSRLVRLTADPAQNYNVALPGSAVVLLGKNSTYANIGAPTLRNSPVPSCGEAGTYVQDCLPADEWSHTIGTLRFAPDGSLFVGNGDGANYGGVQSYAVRALELDSLSGKVLRIDPLTGKGYASNPFYDGNPNSNRSKVYNSGLRNPFRFTFQPGTGVPYIGDVGWNTWEEVDSGRGKNFGWPCYEGGNGPALEQGGYRSLSTCAALYAKNEVSSAAYAYNHGGGGSSVQVGDFYTGTRYPAPYRGALFISDFNQGWLRYLTLSGSGTVLSVNDFGTDKGITQMSAGPGGDLFVINIYSGKFLRLRYTPPETVPLIASAGASVLQGTAPLPVTFSSVGSSGSGTLRYNWTFGDGGESAEANPAHTFAQPGVYRVSLRVSDDTGETTLSSLTVRVNNNPPVAAILSPASGARYTVGDVIPFSGQGTDLEQGTLPESDLSWTVKMHHNDHAHLDGLPPTTGDVGSFVTEDHGDNTYLELCLKVTDAFGEAATDCVSLYPDVVSYTLETVPAGLELPWEGTLRKTPFTVSTNVNAAQQLIAPAQQQGGYMFASWSDGGAREHDVRIEKVPTRLVATYTAPVSPPVPTPTPKTYVRFSVTCRDHYFINNETSKSAKIVWQINRPKKTGSFRLAAKSTKKLTLAAGTSSVTFFLDGVQYRTLKASTKVCR